MLAIKLLTLLLLTSSTLIMNFCGYLPRAINADLRYYSQLHLFDISITEKLESLDYFLSSSSKKSIMDVAGKVNVFIWQLSATLHPSSSFSVCRSDCRLVHHHHLPDEVMSQVLAGFQSGAPAVVREEFPPVITCIQQPLRYFLHLSNISLQDHRLD
jgi:hypothetical protein